MLIFAILVFVAFLYCLFKERNIYNPGTVFFGIWSLVLLLFAINPYSLPEVGNVTILATCIGVSFFGFGILISYLRKKKKRNVLTRTECVVTNNFVDPTIVLLLQFIAIIIYLFLAVPGIKVILSGGSFAYIRYYVRVSTLGSGINALLFTYIATPILYFSLFYSMSIFSTTKIKRKERISLVLTLLMIFFELLTVGGRMSMIVALSSLLVATCIYVSRTRSKSRRKKIFTLLFFAFIAVAIIFTNMVISRGNDDPIKSFSIYLYGSIHFLDVVIEKFNSGGYQYCFGFLSLQGFTSPVISVLGLSNLVFFKNVDSIYTVIDEYVYFNGEILFNSEISFFGYFYLDGGIPVVALLSLVFGYFSEKYYLRIKYKSKITTSDISIYMLLLGSIVMSFIQFSFTAVGYALALVLILVLTKKKAYKYRRLDEHENLCCYTENN